MKTLLTLFAAAPMVVACGFDANTNGSRGFFGLGEGGEIGGEVGDEGGGDGGDGGGDFDRDDCKIEDDNIGRTDVTIQLAGGSVRVSSWVPKADSPGEFVGFTLDVAGEDIIFTVKAGGETFDGSGDSWAHPRGDSGSNVSAISHIDFCENGVPGGGDGGDGDGEGGEGGDGGDDTEGGDDTDGGGDTEGGDDAECPAGTEGCEPGATDGGSTTSETDDGTETQTDCEGEFCG